MGEYIVSIVCGLAFGFLVGYGKFLLLWRRIIKSKKEVLMGEIYIRLGISFGINALALLVVFLLRNTLPFDFTFTIVAVAVGISLCGKMAPSNKILNNVKESAR